MNQRQEFWQQLCSACYCAACSRLGAPSPVDDEQLKEFHLKLSLAARERLREPAPPPPRDTWSHRTKLTRLSDWAATGAGVHTKAHTSPGRPGCEAANASWAGSMCSDRPGIPLDALAFRQNLTYTNARRCRWPELGWAIVAPARGSAA
jgi:hypothetical protein